VDHFRRELYRRQTMNAQQPLSPTARLFGLCGLAPQVIIVYFAFGTDQWQWVAQAAGYAYAAFIFSFLGGVWWGVALRESNAPGWIYGAAIAPSLIALVTFIPWTLGWSWPGPALLVLGTCLILSPLVDQRIRREIPLPDGWLPLRATLSLWLGGLTLLLALKALG
jgi:Protein of unknown function (DUF3429)